MSAGQWFCSFELGAMKRGLEPPHREITGLFSIRRFFNLKHWMCLAVLGVAVSAAADSWASDGVESEEVAATNKEHPQPIKTCNPDYPREALLNRVEGYVVLSYKISEDGVPFDIEVVESVPEGVFDSVSLEAFECWRFQPLDRVWSARYTLNFSLGLDDDD
ncbi:MAG: energy transducer TonB [Pseudomonadota bacterium]